MVGLRTLILIIAVINVNGWWLGRRRRSRIRNVIHHHHTNTNNCHCNTFKQGVLDRLDKIEKKIGIRDVAEILDVDGDYPGLEDFAAHLDTKRDGGIDRHEFDSVIRGVSSVSKANMTNICHCGRALLDNFNNRLL